MPENTTAENIDMRSPAAQPADRQDAVQQPAAPHAGEPAVPGVGLADWDALLDAADRQGTPVPLDGSWGHGLPPEGPLPDAPLPAMPGKSVPAAGSAPEGPGAGISLTPDMLRPMGLEPATPDGEGSGAAAFVRQVLRGGEGEQKPDVPLAASLKETAARAGSLLSGSETPQQRSNPGLFAAMDAPLRGLTPDDILYAGEVDAALSRRPRFGARALSVCVALMFLCLIVWAAFASVDEVTHAEGQVVGAQRTQTIQNLEGGILRAVLVREGQIVEKGAVLAQLDNEMAESAYRDAVNKAMENSLAILRLEAEAGGTQPVYPEQLDLWAQRLVGRPVEHAAVVSAQQIVRDQENLWKSRKQQFNAEIDVLQAQLTQRSHEVEEQMAHKLQLDRSLEISIQQRDAAYALVRRNNFSRLEYLGMQQKVVELQGQVDALAATIPKAQAAAEEARQRIASRRAEQAAAINDEINKRRQELNSLRETLSAGRDRVTRTELRAPVRSTVQQIHIHTVGGVVKPGEPIMDLVPLADTLLVEARVKPQDVAFLRPGQQVMVKISAYDFSIYGGLEGKLESISADTIEDRKGEHYYLAKVRTHSNAIAYHNEHLPIIPGMMVTADILIGKKTVLDYLLKPILKAKQNALRER